MITKFKIFEANNITELNYNSQNLSELPELPDTLEILYCHNNNLSELPELPDTLETLYCHNNNLSELPELPDTLIELSCYNNNLSELPQLPDTLEILDCEDNKLPYDDLEGYWKWFHEYYPVNYPEKYEKFMSKKKQKDFNL